jgi:hypothetical protein
MKANTVNEVDARATNIGAGNEDGRSSYEPGEAGECDVCENG